MMLRHQFITCNYDNKQISFHFLKYSCSHAFAMSIQFISLLPFARTRRNVHKIIYLPYRIVRYIETQSCKARKKSHSSTRNLFYAEESTKVKKLPLDRPPADFCIFHSFHLPFLICMEIDVILDSLKKFNRRPQNKQYIKN
ncbi:hypothetical protein ACKWTF_003776 [Chironomus riparius]